MKPRRPHFLPALLALASGCASYKVIPITEKNQATAEGVRYCRPASYLLVLPAGTPAPPTAADSAAGLPSGALLGLAAKAPAAAPRYQIPYLPDPAQTYAIQSYSGLGSAEIAATLVDGWLLTAYGSKMDTKALETLDREVRRYPAPTGTEATLDLRGLPAGLYVLRYGAGSQRLVLE